MNQILSTNNTSNKKTRNTGPADIKKVLKVFLISMLIFGVFLIGLGAYSIYKQNETENQEFTKPVITIAQKDDETVLLTVSHDKAIETIEYTWNDEETQKITGNGRKFIEQEITIPGGSNTLTVKAIDINGQEISTSKEYETKDIINIETSGNKLKITAENQTEISYMTYRWNEEEETKIEINSKTLEQEIDIPVGENTLTVILVDINNETITKEQKVKGVMKPTIEVTLDDAKENYLIAIKDETGLSKVDVIIRGKTIPVTVEEGKTELKYKIGLNNGDENKLEITAYNTDGIASDTVKKKAKK